MTHDEIKLLIEACSYRPHWQFYADTKGPMVAFQIGCTEMRSIQDPRHPDVYTPWKSGKKFISPHACRQEVIALVFESIVAAEMHEVREWFRYKGASIFNPHLDPDALRSVARLAASFNVRENAMTMDGE
jgi:hypothetical protein